MANKSIKLEKFELNYESIGRLLNGQEISEVLMSYANKAQKELGEEYRATLVQSHDRKKALVVANTENAHNKNLKSNNMLKAVSK